jgi:NAD(P) transhydrogenase subunit alpha
MKPHYYSMLFAFVCLIFMPTVVSAAQAESASEVSNLVKSVSSTEKPTWNRGEVLVVSLTVFILAVFVGFEIIAKVPPTLHTPLMSGSNAISGITVIGAVIAAGQAAGGLGSFLGLIAVVLSMINVVGGFWVTHRMLLMFKRR